MTAVGDHGASLAYGTRQFRQKSTDQAHGDIRRDYMLHRRWDQGVTAAR
ncbi:MAG: hypothetical protein ACRYG8_07790 [Janthinobacterium lividum]